MRGERFVVVSIVVAASVAPVRAEDARPELVAVRTRAAPGIDGALDDAAWQAAVPTTAFTQKFPDEAEAPSEPTELRVLYDDRALYVAFDCVQVATPVTGRLARRDRRVEADWVQIAIDDGGSTYEFSINAAGVLGDGVRFNDTEYSADWDGVWEGEARQHERGWSAELRIPLGIFHRAGVRDWRMQARRYISGRQETVEWAFIPATTAGEVSHYGRLSGIRGVGRSNPIELLPYVAAGVDWTSDVGYDATAGVDLRWRVGERMTIDASVNPDFAQVEVDQRVLNLTTYETFVPEKRPFFVSGMDLFQVPRMELFPSAQTLFYTRRIGAVPDVPVAADPAAVAEPSTIYAAAKLNGRLGERVAAGGVSAVTAPNEVAGLLAAPLAVANVARVRVAAGDGANLGALATALQRFEPEDTDPTMPCPDGATPRDGRCFHDAYAAGLDGSWRSGSGTYAIAGQALVTSIQEGPPRTMPDGTVIAPGDAAPAGRLYVAKEGGRWRGSLEAEAIGRRVDPNDLGYLPRANQVRVVPYLAYRILDPLRAIAEMETYVFSSRRDNLDGLALVHGNYLGHRIRFANFWTLVTEVAYYSARAEDRQVGDGTALRRLPATGVDVIVSTDPRRRIAASVFMETLLTSRGRSFELDGEITYQPLPRLELQLLPRVYATTGDTRFVSGTREDGAYVFGDLTATSVSATLRSSLTFTNRLTLQLYGQLLLVEERYADFASFAVDPAAPRPVIALDELTPTGAPAERPDRDETSLTLSGVLRWEFRPGSTMFLVYSRDGDENALRLKLSYYWN